MLLQPLKRVLHYPIGVRSITSGFTGVDTNIELSNEVKQNIENHWQQNVRKGLFNPSDLKNKFYVLSMFPYPSGDLHMGHVRVYTISDAMARFHRLCGKNVFQPIGWDAFGLPAENAALQHGVEPAEWTSTNIKQMKKQLEMLGCSFDWKHEMSTCSPEYYKWTQNLFLMLYKEKLAYQNEALVNWDPIDKTVLADEQVDVNGCSWRSGAKVEKKLLKQWFIQTTAFAKDLYDSLQDRELQNWRDIKNLQRHWIGECNGYAFLLKTSNSNYIRVWTQSPEHFKDPNAFIVLKTGHYLAQSEDLDSLSVYNPFTETTLPVIFSDKPIFADKCDVYLAAPFFSKEDNQMLDEFGLSYLSESEDQLKNFCPSKDRNDVIEVSKRLKIGGYPVSSKLQDWLISRQRYWGTPIPIIYCDICGTVPVPKNDLPVLLPDKTLCEDGVISCECPKCGSKSAYRETDTMDTFVDSSWYYLRFLDPQNSSDIFNKDLINACMPVDLYVGGKEHAVLHLYYARFMNHFLYSQGIVPSREPFSSLLVQGMVKGLTFRVKGTNRYIKPDEVEILDPKEGKAMLKENNEPVIMSWEKMSKSKLNGVDPNAMFENYGTDTTRLIMLADVAPHSHRNWSSATFPGIIYWQNRLWLTVNNFYNVRSSRQSVPWDLEKNSEFEEEEKGLFDARNYYLKGVTFNFRYSQQLSVAISKMQGLTNTLRRAPQEVICHSEQFQRALACQLIMLAPLAPHFASELWSKFAAAPHHLNAVSDEIKWDCDVFEQNWPQVDSEYKLELSVKVNNAEKCVIKIPRRLLDKTSADEAMDLALNTDAVTSFIKDKMILNTNFDLRPGIGATLNIFIEVDKLKSRVQKKL